MTSTLTRGRSLTAAAQILHGPRIPGRARPKKTNGMPWQQAAWDYYDTVGEYALGVDMLAWGVSQVQLVSAREVPLEGDPEIVTGEPIEGSDEQPSEADRIAADLVAGFAGGRTGQQQLLRRVATQLTVAAESFIVGRATEVEGADDVWDAYSRDEIKVRGNGENVVYVVDDGLEKFALGQNDVLIRVWIPHPRRRQEPRSSSKSLLPILAEIDSLTKAIQAQNDSRLSGAGILIWPDNVELVGGPKASDVGEDGLSPFVANIMDMMVTPLHDQGSASAVVPINVIVPLEAVGKIQWLMRPMIATAKDAEDREVAIKRMARAMDLPPEQILGTGDANHWGAWMIAEDSIKGPIANLASIIVHACTEAWYEAALLTAYKAANISEAEAEDRIIWFDTTALEQRPDRSEQVVAAFDRGGQTLEALVRESGLSVDDIPDEKEMLQILLFLLAKTDPAAAVKLLTTPELFDQIVQTAKPIDQVQPPDDTATDPAQQDIRALPDQPTQDQAPGAAA